MKNPKSFFSKIEKYQAPSTILFRSIELKLLKEKLSHLLNVRPALDLGCGQGIAAAVVFDQRIDYGLDNNPVSLKQAKKREIYKKIILADATSIPLSDKSVSLVFSNCVVEHLKDLDSALKEIFRILTKKGFFIFTVPSNHFASYSIFSHLRLSWLAKAYGRLRNKKYNHYHCYSLKKWALILKKFNLRQVDSFYYIDKKTLELWDFLLILGSFCKYKAFYRKLIYKKFEKARVAKTDGAAICIVAQKK